jgi:hypothetical protein
LPREPERGAGGGDSGDHGPSTDRPSAPREPHGRTAAAIAATASKPNSSAQKYAAGVQAPLQRCAAARKHFCC